MRVRSSATIKTGAALSIVIAGLLGAACERGQDDSAARPTAPGAESPVGPAVPGVPAGYRLHADREGGFQIAVPEHWQEVPLDPSALDETARTNPGLATMVDQARAALSQGGLFLAGDPRPTTGFSPRVNLIRLDAPGISLDDIEPTMKSQLELAGATDVTTDRRTTPAGPGIRGRYTLRVTTSAGVPVLARGAQYFVVAGGTGYVLTVTAGGAAALTGLEQLASTFDLL